MAPKILGVVLRIFWGWAENCSLDWCRKLVELLFHFLGMISTHKFARKVTMARVTLGLILKIFRGSIEF